MPKLTLALIVGLIALTIVLLFAATRTGQQQPPTQTQPTPSVPTSSPSPTPPAYTTLELSPNPVTVTAGTGKIDVLINTNQNTMSGVQLELSFDPKAITNVVVTPGTLIQNPLILAELNKIDQETGRISYAQFVQSTQSEFKGQGVIATITFSKVATTPLTETQIEFMPKTTISQTGISPSVLKSSTGTTVNLGTPTTNQAIPVSPTATTQ